MDSINKKKAETLIPEIFEEQLSFDNILDKYENKQTEEIDEFQVVNKINAQK